MGVIREFIGWGVRKLFTGLLLAVFTMTLSLAFIWVNEQRYLEQERLIRLQDLKVEQLKIESDLAAADTKLETLRNDLQDQSERAQKLERIVATLNPLQGWWSFLFGDPAQNRRNREQLERAKTNQRNTQLMLEELSAKIEETLGLQVDLNERRDDVLHELSHQDNPMGFYHFFRSAWERSKWVIIAVLVLYFLGPTVTKLAGFFAFGRLFGGSGSVVINKEPRLLPEIRTEGTVLEVGLWPGEVAWLKKRIIQSSGGGVERVLSWIFPISALSSGLVGLEELANKHAGDPVGLTLSDRDHPHNDLALVRVPEGGSIVIRPSFVAGVIKPHAEELVVKRRWRFFQWHAWISGQFRYFEFQGPVRLVVVGGGGLLTNWLSAPVETELSVGRARQESTIGFTPNLKVHTVRAKKFWPYYRDRNPLFDDEFVGEGVFICRGNASYLSFPARLWDALIRAFGV